jgi:hypothetical protein
MGYLGGQYLHYQMQGLREKHQYKNHHSYQNILYYFSPFFPKICFPILMGRQKNPSDL